MKLGLINTLVVLIAFCANIWAWKALPTFRSTNHGLARFRGLPIFSSKSSFKTSANIQSFQPKQKHIQVGDVVTAEVDDITGGLQNPLIIFNVSLFSCSFFHTGLTYYR